MSPTEAVPLPTQVQADVRESASSFLIRVMTANRITPSQLYASTGRSRPRTLQSEDIRSLSHATQTSPEWFEWRVPEPTRVDGELHSRLFGQTWRSRWMVRRVRQQVCPACLHEHGLARWQWDLTAFCVCPDHGTLLRDHCDCCQQSLVPYRPSLEVCRCRHYLSDHRTPPRLADDLLVQWCAWISGRLRHEISAAPTLPPGIASLFAGMSIDAATCVAAAFAGGKRRIETGKLNSTQPWLTTSVVAEVLSQGLHALARFVDSEPSRFALPDQGISDLEDLAIDGHTAHDRGAASWVLRRSRGRRLRTRTVKAMAQQGDLFEGDL